MKKKSYGLMLIACVGAGFIVGQIGRAVGLPLWLTLIICGVAGLVVAGLWPEE